MFTKKNSPDRVLNPVRANYINFLGKYSAKIYFTKLKTYLLTVL